jgi:hypothetical protein
MVLLAITVSSYGSNETPEKSGGRAVFSKDEQAPIGKAIFLAEYGERKKSKGTGNNPQPNRK